jgi:uncharacterized protein YoxC
LDWLSAVIVQPVTIGVVITGLLVWTLLSGWSARRGLANLGRSLRRARERLGTATDQLAFSADYEAISADLLAIPLIGNRWREYRETLIVPATPTRPVRATARAEQWFDLSLCADAGVDQRYHAALPNLLVGAGLLFTFLGLAVALQRAGGIVAEGISQTERNEALHGLLETASFKFTTSLAGLALSILYALFWRRWCLRPIEKLLANFLTDLEERIPLRTSAAVQEEANDLARDQLTQLQSFSNDLAISIADALDGKFDKRLGDHIGPLTQAMENLSNRMATQNQDAIAKMLETFIDKLRGGAGDRMQEVANRLAGLGDSLQGLRTGLQDAAARMAEAAEGMAVRMGQGAEQALSGLTVQMGGLIEQLRAVSDQTTKAGADAGDELVARIAGAAATLDRSATIMAEALGRSAETTGSRLQQGAEDAVRTIAGATEGMRSALQQAGDGAAGQLNQAAGEVASQVGAMAREMTGLAQTAAALSQRIEALQRAVGEATSPITASAADLRAASEAARASVQPLRDVSQSVTNSIEQIGGAARRIEAANEGAQSLSHALAVAAQRFDGIDGKLGDVVAKLQSGIDRFARDVSDFVAKTDANLAKAVTHLNASINQLVDALEDHRPQQPPSLRRAGE